MGREFFDMKNFTFILTSVLTFFVVSTPRQSSFAADCSQSPNLSPDESSVLCWLKINQPQSLTVIEKQVKSANNTVFN
jgi:hypothetical protein